MLKRENMKLTTKSEYSLLALIYLARNGQDDYISVDTICEKYDISKKYLEALITILKQNHFIITKRGPRGGHKLAKLPTEIRVADIIRLMDGALAPTESVSKYFYADTPLLQEEKILREFKEIRDYIANRLERLTLAELI